MYKIVRKKIIINKHGRWEGVVKSHDALPLRHRRLNIFDFRPNSVPGRRPLRRSGRHSCVEIDGTNERRIVPSVQYTNNGNVLFNYVERLQDAKSEFFAFP